MVGEDDGLPADTWHGEQEMSTMTSDELKARFAGLKLNPYATKRLMLNMVEELTDGAVVMVEATNPVTLLMEAVAVNSAAQMSQTESVSRRVYASLAQTPEELYPHMSDIDFAERFSTPSNVLMYFYLDLAEVRQKAVNVNGVYRKLTIPRHSTVTVGGMSFMLQYPIDIRVMKGGGINVVYDTDYPSPLQALEGNAVVWDAVNFRDTNLIRLKVPMLQMACQSNIIPLNNVTGVSKKYTFTDQFFYTRAYMKGANDNVWTEIKTTHSEQVVDPLDTTLVLQVAGDTIGIHVPQIYFTNGFYVNGDRKQPDAIRVDIYTTKGKLDIVMNTYDANNFVADWVDRDSVDDNQFSAPLSTFSTMVVFTDNPVNGGRDELSFSELRERVVNNELDLPLVPITAGTLESTLKLLGFGFINNVDNITDREFLALRTAPVPSNKSTISGAGCTVEKLVVNMNTLAGLPTVEPHTLRQTILPTTVYQSVNGVPQIVPNTTIISLLTQPPEAQAAAFNSGSYLYSPFYWVLDANNDEFNLRPYRLDKPTAGKRYHIDDNALAAIDINTSKVTLGMADDGSGYEVLVEVAKPSPNMLAAASVSMNCINAQISFIPPNATTRVFVNGTQIAPIDPSTNLPVNNRFVWRFPLTTTFDVTAEHYLMLETPNVATALQQDIDIVFIVNGQGSGVLSFLEDPAIVPNSNIDTLYDVSLYNPIFRYVGVAHERVSLEFGTYLERLWQRSRTIMGARIPELWANDELSYYPQTIFKQDPLTGTIQVDYVSGNLVYVIDHLKDEPILEAGYVDNDDTDAAVASDTHITFTAGSFTSADVGKTFILRGAGAGGVSLFGKILDVVSSTEVELDTPVVTGVSAGALFRYGVQVYAHRVGDVKIVAGEIVYQNSGQYEMVRHLDIFMIDAKYRFATDESTIAYRNELVDQIVDWCVNDLNKIQQKLLDRTAVYFYPRSSIGNVSVNLPNGGTRTIKAEQYVNVRYYVTSNRFANADLKDQITANTIAALDQALQQQTVSRTLLENKLLTMVGEDAVSVAISGFGNDTDPVYSMLNESYQLAIGKRLMVQSNRTLKVTDAVNVEFIVID